MLINVHKLFTKFWDVQVEKNYIGVESAKNKNATQTGGVNFVLNTTN